MSFDGGGKVEWNEGGPHIGGFAISTEEAIRSGSGPAVDGNDGFGSQLPESPSEVFGRWLGIAIGAVAFLGMHSCYHDASTKPAEPPSTYAPHKTSSMGPASEPVTQIAPLVKGAYYRAANASAAHAVIEGPHGPEEVKFPQNACIVVTNPRPIAGSRVVEIDVPRSDAIGNTKGFVDQSQLAPAPACYERRMP